MRKEDREEIYVKLQVAALGDGIMMLNFNSRWIAACKMEEKED